MLKKIGALTLIGGIAITIVACNSGLSGNLGGSSPVASFLPGDITLDVSELPDTSTATGKTINRAMSITGVTAFDHTLRATGAILHEFHRVAKRVLALGAAVRSDFTSSDQTQVTGTFTVNGQSVDYRADFAAFDVDGDGTPDGSGKANVEPVAVRMWVDRGTGFERFFCALVSTRPTTANLGSGQMIVRPSAVNGSEFTDLQIKMQWDRTDASHKWNDAFINGRIRQGYAMSGGHQRVDVRTNTDGTIEKTVRSTDILTENPFGFTNASFATHFQVGTGFILISGQATGGTAQLNFSNVCINETDKNVTTGGGCDTYDTQDMTFLDVPAGSEADFPADFPAQPTFTNPTTISATVQSQT